jgi:hypothetical protein
MVKTRNKAVSVVLFLAALALGLDAQPGWSLFKPFDNINYTQCDIVIPGSKASILLVGIVVLPDGRVVAAGLTGGGIYVFPPLPADGSACPTSSPVKLNPTRWYRGLALGLDGKIYANEALPTHDLVTIDPNNGNQSVISAGLTGLALVLDPLTGDLYATDANSTPVIMKISGIYPGQGPVVVNPTWATLTGKDLDGLAWSCDGTMLIAASSSTQELINIDRSGNYSPLVKFPGTPRPDGVAFGAEGTVLEGYMFVNNNDGSLYQVPIINNGSQFTSIGSNGYRGDFVAVDLQGNLLLTQHDIVGTADDRITRVASKFGGKFELPGSTMCNGLHCLTRALAANACISILATSVESSPSSPPGKDIAGLVDAACTLNGCGKCQLVKENLEALFARIRDIGTACLAPLDLAAHTLYNSLPCTKTTWTDVSPCPSCITDLNPGGVTEQIPTWMREDPADHLFRSTRDFLGWDSMPVESSWLSSISFAAAQLPTVRQGKDSTTVAKGGVR